MPVAPPHFRNLLLKDQVLKVYAFAGMTAENVPKKNQRTVLCDPNQRLQITVAPHHQKSTYDKPLYLCEHSNY